MPIFLLDVNNWFRTGIWVALTAGFYILVNEVLQHNPLYETWRWHIWKGLVGAGGFLCLLSKIFGHGKHGAPASAGSASGGIKFHEDEDGETPPPFFTLRYCGLILSTFGAVVRVVIPDNEIGIRIAAREEASRKAPAEEVAPTNAEPAAVEFPVLNVKGVFCSKTRPSAFVNNKTYFIGEDIDGVKIVSILPDSIVVEKSGSQKTILLRH